MKRIFNFVLAALLLIGTATGAFETPNFPAIGILMPGNQHTVIDNIARNLWVQVAGKLNAQYKFVPVANVQQAYQDLRDNKMQLLVGPIKMQRDVRGIRFIDAYIQDNLGVVIPLHSVGTWAIVWPFILTLLSWGVGSLLIGLIIFAFLVWLCECRVNPIFSKKIHRGFFTGIWLGFETLTTVGYGSAVPRTVLGRILAVIWMMVSVFIMAGFVGGVIAEFSSARTAIRAQFDVKNLAHHQVVYLKGNSNALRLIEHYKGRPLTANTPTQVMDMLDKKRVYAAVFNRLDARYYLHQHPEKNLVLTDYVFPTTHYAFAMSDKNPYADDVGIVLQELSQSGAITQIEDGLMGKSNLPRFE